MSGQKATSGYVVAPCRNAFNGRASWRLPMKGRTAAMRMSAADSRKEAACRTERIGGCIRMFP